MHQFAGGFDGGFGNACHNVRWSPGIDDRLVQQSHGCGGDVFGAGMRIEHHRVAGGNHGDGVVDDGRGGIGDGGDRADDTKGGGFDEHQAVVAGLGPGEQVFGARGFMRN
ncbi:MAG: hypothetical protein BWY17_02878 [Deltaproteobacteria bacterium ADurb.Bin207]|nr:MAG: hypothetical protein BWY17_02878 [Deltaproteobacteria bacterium ADurb.Bin207]